MIFRHLEKSHLSQIDGIVGILMVFVMASSLLPAIPVVVDTFKVFDKNISIAEAENRTLSFARECAIKKAIPEQVATTSLFSDLRGEAGKIAVEQTAISIFAVSTQAGYIIEEKIEYAKPVFEKNTLQYNVRLRAKIEPNKGERNPALSLELEPTNNFLKEGETLVISGKASVDGYLYLFDFLSDNTILLMFPNPLTKNNFIKANTRFQIPTEEESKRGIQYKVVANPNVKITAEAIFGVFCINPIAGIDQFVGLKPGFVLFSGGSESYTKFQQWLVNVPLSQRTEKAVPIQIVK